MTGPKTYVAIPSYRDSELKKTVKDLFEKACRPDDIVVGCFIACFDDEKDLCFPEKRSNVKVLHTIPGTLFSVSQCRNLALSFLTDELTYVLQIDSHMRFEQGWDDTLITSLNNVGDDRAVLSGVTPGYRTLGGVEEILTHLNDEIKILSYDTEHAKSVYMKAYELVPGMLAGDNTKDYQESWYLSGAFIYSYAEFFREVPQVPWIYFWGEEIMHSARAFTKGWNCYILKHVPMFHLWREDRQYEGVPLGRIFDDFPNQVEWRTSYTTERCIEIIVNNEIGPDSLFPDRSIKELRLRIGYDIQKILSGWEEEYISINGSRRQYDRVAPVPSDAIKDRL